MHSSLLRKFVNYGREKFYNIRTWVTHKYRLARKKIAGDKHSDLSFPSVCDKKEKYIALTKLPWAFTTNLLMPLINRVVL
jgi:hypothetical protein